ncbi:hypothetical protein EDEG_02798 [Edhazardia aedis USNM 41457]|uniref:Aquaporin n=1 Tax=Edhazardia aedis (strain USNM 41457) TaxID=1003232 RepID=J8ZT18_EDHAE|nr:hypothetical protein EDEG_02798 [Edhazardia aedis USNM 41457]|eukprot:EJW02813.1 hypothetical protein EDEG_02798 [Edhazardia aedis USNM 41457]
MGLTFNWKQVQSYIGEMAASFVFGFSVYSAAISSSLTDSMCGPVIVGLAVCFSSIAIIYTFADITLAHFNPAITFSAIIFGKLIWYKGAIYIISQCLGFMIAAAVVLGCYPSTVRNKLEIIRPKKVDDDVTKGNLICTEMFLTGILTFVAFQVAINVYKKPKYIKSEEEKLLPEGAEDHIDIEDSKPDTTILAPLVIGLTLGFLAFLGFSSSGGVFNPGLVWAPVLFSGDWYDSWAYWVGEFTGSLVGAAIQVFILARMY